MTVRKLKTNAAFNAAYGGKNQKFHPIPPVWMVRAENCDGHKPDYEYMGFSVEDAMKHADWLHQSRGVMNVTISYPAYVGPKAAPTEQDVAMGHALAEILDNRTVLPSAKLNINLWLDSKEWP